MHDNWSLRLSGKTGPYASKHLKLKFEEFDYGFIYKRVRGGFRRAQSVLDRGAGRADAHASQCSFNMPLVLNQRGMPGASRLGLSGPMRLIFSVDCVMTVANIALWLMLWRVA